MGVQHVQVWLHAVMSTVRGNQLPKNVSNQVDFTSTHAEERDCLSLRTNRSQERARPTIKASPDPNPDLQLIANCVPYIEPHVASEELFALCVGKKLIDVCHPT